MGSKIQYISSGQQLISTVEALLNDNIGPDIMISGVWTKSLHEDIISLIMNKQYSSTCRVIIPKLIFKGNISLSLLRSLCKAGGQVRVNNSLTNNLLLIGGYAFILSFSSKLNSFNMLSTVFECSVMTDEAGVVNELKTQFGDIFENSVIFRM
ncbi:MAG: hypothetical protein VB106_07465 [Clostridiaceae bacterium]|jgi:hypothetical protein|nr:hypothetical protein [Clostridiaceae bacterium]